MAKKLIRLTEGDLHRIVKKSVSKILKEGSTSMWNGEYYQVQNFITEFQRIMEKSLFQQTNNREVENAYLDVAGALQTLEETLKSIVDSDKFGKYGVNQQQQSQDPFNGTF